tara:strand:+ start:1053 stop:2117 length:1065 start_codon:yes stop_codon:yes gene_type:complete
MKILITGGAGFIGSALVRHIINKSNDQVLCIDKLTYAGNLKNLESIFKNDRFNFEKIDICDQKMLTKAFFKYKPHAVMHLAAESHVDKSITGPGNFISTNIVGTYNLLEVSRMYFESIKNPAAKKQFKFHHISTDEVYGDLGESDPPFDENSPYKPSSPYSASKASSDHLVRSWHRTYGLPVIVSNCTNNYGPFHYPEKLIPQTILNAVMGKNIPIYGDGTQIRDWLFVEDHAEALFTLVKKGIVGKTYNIGADNEIKNIDVVKNICKKLDKIYPISVNPNIKNKKLKIDSYEKLIKFVKDRPGHDLRYALDSSEIKKEFKWKPQRGFEENIEKTIRWYLDNLEWTTSNINNNL